MLTAPRAFLVAGGAHRRFLPDCPPFDRVDFHLGTSLPPDPDHSSAGPALIFLLCLAQIVLAGDVVPIEEVPRPVAAEAMATDSGAPARTMFRTAVRRRSWKSRPSTSAFVQAGFQDLRNSPIGFRLRWKTCSAIRTSPPFSSTARAFLQIQTGPSDQSTCARESARMGDRHILVVQRERGGPQPRNTTAYLYY